MNRKLLLILTVVFLALPGWGLLLHHYIQPSNKDNYHGILYYREAPNLTLTDHNGKRVTLSQFRGKLTLVAWGYTHCPDVCILTLSMLRDMMKELGELAGSVQVLYITVDPQRDNIDRLKSFIPAFHESFIGLTGTPQEIEDFAKAYDVFFINHGDHYGRGKFDTWDKYLMTHTTTIYLIDQKGRLRITYPYDKFDAKEIAGDIRRFLS